MTRDFWQPHRIGLILAALALCIWAGVALRWDWIPRYAGLGLEGLWRTLWLLGLSLLIGFAMAVPLGLAQAAGPRILAVPARWFCTMVRGTPLLLQIWLIYFGLGSLFPQFPAIRQSELWPYLRQAWPYALLALSISYAGYEGEVMRGAFKSVPHGQLESARAFGLSRWAVFRRNLAAASSGAVTADPGRRGDLATQSHASGGDDHGDRDLCRRQPRAAGYVHHL